MVQATSCGVVAVSAWHIFFYLALFGFNYYLSVSVSKIKAANCFEPGLAFIPEEEIKVRKPRKGWKVDEYNQYRLNEMARYRSFDWEEEMLKVRELIPVLELRTNEESPDTDVDREPGDIDNRTFSNSNYEKSKKLPYASDKVSTEKIVNEIKKVNQQYEGLYLHENGIEHSLWDSIRKEVFPNGLLLCKEFDELEKRHSFPRIKYTFRALYQWKGEIQLKSGNKFPVKLHRIQKISKLIHSHSNSQKYIWTARKDQTPYVDKNFEHVKNELLSLLKTQGWYGTPRLLGVCLSSSNGEDIIDNIIKGKSFASLQPKVLRYLVSRHDSGTLKLCETYTAEFQCQRMYPALGIIKRREKPVENALRLMMNTARLFEQLENNGAVIYNFIGMEFLFDSKYDVLITDFSTLRFLDTNENTEQSEDGIERLLSGTICKTHKQCSPVSWQSNTISYKLGFPCKEIKGFCSSQNRCWGIDSSVHACVFSRWMFAQLRAAFPSAWTYSANLTAAIECGSAESPEDRCSWSYLRSILTELYQVTVQESNR